MDCVPCLVPVWLIGGGEDVVADFEAECCVLVFPGFGFCEFEDCVVSFLVGGSDHVLGVVDEDVPDCDGVFDGSVFLVE